MPAALVLVKTGEGDVVANAVVGGVLPDCGFQPFQDEARGLACAVMVLLPWVAAGFGLRFC